MELEQRVKALEQEVEILKNQIQATLLDIREMLLTSAYPSLRAGDAEKQTEPKRPARAAQPAQGPSQGETPDEAPIVRKVALDNAQAESSATQARAAGPVKAVRQAAQPEEDEADESDHKPVVRKVSLNDEQTPTTAYQNSKARSTFDPEQANLEAWVRNKVEQVGVDRTWELIQLYTQKGHITSEIRDTLLQALAPYAEQTEPERPQRRVALPPTDEDEEPGDNTQRMVLRLIAGVQNAGVGLARRKARNG
jgi:hypothetical protein